MTQKFDVNTTNSGHYPFWVELADIQGVWGKLLFILYALLYRHKTSYLITIAFYEGERYASTKYFYHTFCVESNWKSPNYQDIWDEINGNTETIRSLRDPIPRQFGRWEVVMIKKLTKFEADMVDMGGVIDAFTWSGQLTSRKPFCWIKEKDKVPDNLMHNTKYQDEKSKRIKQEDEERMSDFGGCFDYENYWER